MKKIILNSLLVALGLGSFFILNLFEENTLFMIKYQWVFVSVSLISSIFLFFLNLKQSEKYSKSIILFKILGLGGILYFSFILYVILTINPKIGF